MRSVLQLSIISLVFLCISTISPVVVKAQTTVTIGNSTSYSRYTPINRYYYYSASDAIYLNSEINESGEITKLAFYKATGSNSTTISGVSIYMKHTSATTLTTGSHSTSGYTLVWSGAFPNNSTGWKEVTLTTPFAYNGNDNLQIYVRKNYQSSTSYYPQYRYTSMSSPYKARYGYGSSMPTNLNQISYRPNVRMVIEPTNHNDAGITAITEPSITTTTGLKSVKAILKNYGKANLTSCVIKYSLDGYYQGSINFSGSIAKNGTNGPLAIGNVNLGLGNHEIKVWTESPNSVLDSNAINDTTTINVLACQTLNGTYSVGGSNANFQNFSDAATTLSSCGISGPVVFNVQPGIYNEQISIPPIAGSSLSNTITFQSSTGDSSDVQLNFAPTSSLTNYTVKLNGVDNIKFKNLGFKSSGTSYSRVFEFANDANRVEISNCAIEGPVTTSTSYNNCIVFSGNSSDDTISILNNHIKNGSIGIRMQGYSSTVLETGLSIQGNTIENYASIGIAAEYQSAHKINGNTLTAQGTSSTGIGIANYYCDNNIEINGNAILINGTGINYGVYFYYCDGISSNKGLITNNMISELTPTTNTSFGIYLYRCYNQRIFYNSVQIISSNNLSSALHISNYTGMDILNNTFSNLGSGYATYVGSASSVSFSDFNNYFSNGTYLAYWNGNQTSFTSLKVASGKDASSYNIDPQFYSNTNLHSYSPTLNGAGIPIAAIATDIDGETRNAISPDIGADEFTIPANDVGVIGFVYPSQNPCVGPTPITIRIKNYGSASLTSATIAWKVNGVSQTSHSWTGNIAPNATDTISIGSYTFAQNVTYSINVWSIAPNASSDGNTANDEYTKSGLTTSLGGTLTVGAGGNYSTINAAVADLLAKGVCAPTYVNIAPGFYSEQVTIPYIPGSDSINTITFQSSTGDSSNVIITSSPSSAATNYVINLDSAQYVNIKSLTIQNSSTNYGTAISIKNLSSHIGILNNKLVGATTTSTSSNLAVINSPSTREDYVRIENNYILGGTYGIFCNALSSNMETGLLIKNNKLVNQYIYGIFTNYISAPVITENELTSTTSSSQSYVGIYSNRMANNFEITKNTITPSTAGYGMYFYFSNSLSTSRGLVANNFVKLSTYGYSTSGMFFYNASYINVYHNSIHITGSMAGYSNRCFALDGAISNFDIKNNIFANNALGIAFYTDASYNNFTSDYNDLYTTGTQLVYNDYNNIYYQTLAMWSSATGDDASSLSLNPEYKTDSDLHIANYALKSSGTPVSQVTDDIDGDTRSTTSPDIGADEFIIPAIDAGLVQFVDLNNSICMGTNPINVEIRNTGSSVLTSATVNWKVNGVSQSAYAWTGSLVLGASDTVTLGNFTFALSGTYSIEAEVSQPNNVADQDTSNNIISHSNLTTSLGGTFSVGGSGADYATLSLAITDLNTKGICAPVVFNIASGTYTEQLYFPPTISGVSATNTITFQSATGDSSDVNIQYNTNSSSANYVVRFAGANYIQLKNLTFKTTATGSYGRVIDFYGASQFITISNCQIIGRNTSNYSDYYSLFYNNGYDNEGLTLSSNLFKYGSYGIYNKGISSLTDSTKILNNIFDDQYSYGMYLYYHNAPIVSGNEIIITSGSYASYVSIYMRYCDKAFKVTKNKISSASNGGYGIYLYYCDGTSSQKGLIANNFIQLNTSGNQTHGIYCYYSYQHEFYFNSINITGNYASANNTCLRYYGSSYAYYTLKNNNFINQAGGYALYMYSSPSSSYITSDYNNMYTSGTYFNYWSGSRTSLSAWRSYSGKDMNSLSVNPQFTSNSDLHIGNVSLNGKGTPIATITTDIDGDIRQTKPDIGADELFVSPMAGIYTIGLDASDDFSSFTTAAQAISGRGISANVTFNVDSGAYNEQFQLTDIDGATSSKVVIFQSASGDSSDVVVSYDASSSTDNYVVKFDNSDFITLKGITFKALDNTYSYVISLNNDSNITIQNCQLEAPITTTTSNSASIIGATGKKKNINIKNNYIVNGAYGFYFAGYSTSIRDANVTIENNVIINQNVYGLYLLYQEAPIVKGNTIYSNKDVSSNYFGAYLYYCDNNLKFIENKIQVEGDGGYGIYARYCDGTSSSKGLIANNFISVKSTTKIAYGFYCNYTNQQKISFNNINIYGTYTSGGYGLFMYGASGTNSLDVKNNNFTIKLNGGYPIYANIHPSYYTNNHNNLHTTGTYLAYEYGTSCSTLAAWKSNSAEGYNSINVDPNYISNKNLHVNNNALNNAGTPVTGVTKDIDGETRNSSSPDIGADEFSPSQYDIAIVELATPNTSGCFSSIETVTIRLKNFGTQSIYLSSRPVTINASVSGQVSSTFTPVVINSGTLSPGSTMDVNITTTLNMASGGAYTFNASSSMTNDGNAYNNNLSPTTINNTSINTFPVNEPFTTFPNGIVVSQAGWEGSSTNSSSYKWFADYGGTGTSYSGPYYDASGSSYGRYLYVESSYGSTNEQAYFVSSCIDISALTNPKLSFKYHMFGSGMGELAVDVLYNGTWTALDSIQGQQQTSRYAAWIENIVDLDSYSGVVKVRFRATKTINSTYGDMAIDNINISDYPTVNLGSDTGACQGQTVTLNAGPGTSYSYQWYKLGTTNLQNATQYFTVNTTGTYYVIVTNAHGNSEIDTIQVSISNPATPSFTGLASSYCSSDAAVNLVGSPSGGAFAGSGIVGSGIVGNSFDPSVANSGIQTINYTYTNSFGCSSTIAGVTNIKTAPMATIGGLGSIYCINDTIATANLSPSGGSFTGAGITGNTFNPITAGSGIHELIYTVSGSNLCIDRDTLQVEVIAVPSVSFTGLNVDYCQDDSGDTLTGIPAGGTFFGLGISGNVFSAFDAGAGTHQITYNSAPDSNGCFNSTDISALVYPAPIAIESNDTTFCPGETATLSVNTMGPYVWSTGALTQTIDVSPLQTTTYRVSVYDMNGCMGSDSVTVNLHSLPIVFAGDDTTMICGGSALSIGTNPMTHNTYLWSPTNGLSDSTVANPMAIPSITTKYILSVTNTFTSCVNTDSITVTRTPQPIAIASMDTTICIGDTAYLSVSGGVTRFWNTGDSIASIKASPAATTSYIATVQDGYCFDSDTIVVNVNNPIVNLGNDTTICHTAAINLDAGFGFQSYLWSDNSLNQTLLVDSMTFGMGTHAFSVIVNDTLGCSAKDSVEITINNCTGIEDITDRFDIGVYPNPTKGKVNLSIVGSETANLNVCLLSLTGQVLWCEDVAKTSDKLIKEIDLSMLAKGLYYLKISSNDKIMIQKIVLQ